MFWTIFRPAPILRAWLYHDCYGFWMRIHRFTIISGLGWLMDVGLMAILVDHGAPVFVANVFSAAVAITFVFFAAQNRVFVNNGHFLFRQFGSYIGFQCLAVPLASLLIHELAAIMMASGLADQPLLALLAPSPSLHTTIVSVLAKCLVTPATLYCNFVFMGWLVERRLSYW